MLSAGLPSSAVRPADDTLIFLPASLSFNRYSAVGLRQILPAHTTNTELNTLISPYLVVISSTLSNVAIDGSNKLIKRFQRANGAEVT